MKCETCKYCAFIVNGINRDDDSPKILTIKHPDTGSIDYGLSHGAYCKLVGFFIDEVESCSAYDRAKNGRKMKPI